MLRMVMMTAMFLPIPQTMVLKTPSMSSLILSTMLMELTGLRDGLYGEKITENDEVKLSNSFLIPELWESQRKPYPEYQMTQSHVKIKGV